MKKIQYILLIACLAFSSCNSWLDVKPEDQVSEEDQLSTREGVMEVVNGLYLSLSNTNGYGFEMSAGATDILAQLYMIEANNQGETHWASEFVEYNYEMTKPTFEGIWQHAYNHIANVNNLIERLPIAKGLFTERDYSVLRAELYALRAYLHFDMLRLFGPIPLAENLGVKAIPYYTFRTTEPQPILTLQEMYDAIAKDLEAAEYGLLNDPIFSGTTGGRQCRMNYIAVRALQARIALYKGNKAEAAQIARSLIGTDGGVATFVAKLAPWVTRSAAENTSAPDRYFVNEAIFAIENSGKQSVYTSYFDYNVKANTYLAPNRKFIDDKYNTKDYRYNSWKINPGNGKEVEFAKFQIVNWNNASKNLQPLIRKSELYLILAEATDSRTEALNILDLLYINRGYEAGYVNSLVNENNWDNFIQDEYLKEFYGEGQYFFYLKRRNKPSVYNQASDNNIELGQAQYVVPLPDSEIKFRD